MNPPPFSYKETILPDNLNNGMEWVFRDFFIYLNRAKDPMTSMDNVVECDVSNDSKELEKSLKI